jgi:hypothetical protein
LLVLLPKISSLKVILANSTSDPYVIDCLFIDEFDSLVFRKHWLKALKDFLACKSGERSSEILAVKEL